MKTVLRMYKKTVSITTETAIGIYESLGRNKIGYLLESYDKSNGRYTFLAIEPDELIQSLKNSLVITRKNGEKEVLEGNPYEKIKEYYSRFDIICDEGEPAFGGGFVGSMGYDFVKYVEELPDENPDEIEIETIQFMFAKKFIVIDHMAETMTAVVLGEDSESGREAAVNDAQELLKTAVMKEEIKEEEAIIDGKIINKTDTVDSYGKKVEAIKNYIKEGHIFQTVLSQRWTIETGEDGFRLYKKLRVLNPSPYLYYFNFGDFEIIGSSPEMIVKQEGNTVLTCPIAGTRKRGKTPEEDKFLKEDLLSDEKEKAEHVMLVDLARNDMGKISEFGSVKVKKFMEVQNYSHVMHIVSLVEGKKAGEYHPFDLVASFLPAGTLSGAPKIRAMEIIDELETVKRGLYGGAIGYIGFNGNMDFCITIRTMIKKGNKVYLQAGAGIVADSVPESEYMECCNKVMALAKTVVKEENL